MRAFLSRSRRPVVFAFAPKFAGSGTSVMRGEQLSRLIAESGKIDRPIGYRAFTHRFRNSDLFLTKGVLKLVEPEALEALQRRGNRLFADPVDEPIPDEIALRADVIVAASRVAFDAYTSRWPAASVRLLNHHVDPRVISAMQHSPSPQHAHARIAYFGELENTLSSDAIGELVDFISVDTSRRDDSWFSRLPDYNFHYAIRRPRALDDHKPFLKGFTAAACTSNILIQANQAEAARWLPSDYPFWHHGDVAEHDLVASLHRVAESYGGPEWRYGLEVMAEVADQTSASAIANEADRIFRDPLTA